MDPGEADVLTQLQGALDDIAIKMYAYVGVIQRDAPVDTTVSAAPGPIPAASPVPSSPAAATPFSPDGLDHGPSQVSNAPGDPGLANGGIPKDDDDADDDDAAGEAPAPSPLVPGVSGIAATPAGEFKGKIREYAREVVATYRNIDQLISRVGAEIESELGSEEDKLRQGEAETTRAGVELDRETMEVENLLGSVRVALREVETDEDSFIKDTSVSLQ